MGYIKNKKRNLIKMSGFFIALSMCLLVLVEVEGYKKSNMGSACSEKAYDIQTEQECISACQSMGIEYLGSWDGPGEIPKCTYTEGLNKVCHFNISPNPSRTGIRKEYSAICLECADTHAGYQLSVMGQLCNPQTLELQTERECINACNELGYQYLGSWNGPNDFPKCTVVLGGNKACHFNTSPVPDRVNPNKDYAAVCKKA